MGTFRILILIIFMMGLPEPCSGQQIPSAAQEVLSEEEQGYIFAHPELRVQVAETWAPFNFRQNEQNKGYINDYLRLLGSKLGIRFTFVPGYTWDQYLVMLDQGEIDLISNMTITPERRRLYLFSQQPVVNIFDSLLIRKDMRQLSDLEALRGHTLAVVKSYSHEELLRQYYPDIPILLTDNLLESIRQVISGKADAAIGAHAVLNHLITEHLLSDVICSPIRENKIFPGSPHYLAVTGKNVQLMTILDKGMSLIQDSEVKELQHRWLDITTSQKSILFTPEEEQYLTQKQEITMCVDPDWMPLEKIDQGKHVGMAADYIALLQERLGIPITLVPTVNWSESIQLAKERKCDIFSLAMPTPERRTYMYFSTPYLKIPLVVATKTGTPFLPDITAVNDKKLGVVKGYAFGELLRRKYPQLNIIDVKSLRDGLNKTANGKIFGFIGTLATVGYTIQKDYLGELKVAGKFDMAWELGIASRNDEPLLNAVFNKAIASIDEGEQQHILNRWISVTFEQGTDYRILSRILLLVGCGVAFLLYRYLTINKYNRRLMTQNSEIRRQTALLEQTQKELLLTQYAIDSSAFPICWLESEKTLDITPISYANQAAVNLLGYSREELLQLSLTEIDCRLTSTKAADIGDSLTAGSAHSMTTIYRRKDNTTFPAEVYINAFQYEERSFYFLFFIDVSKAKELENKLHHSMKMEAIGTMAGGVAHDLNNILSGIVSYPELLLLKLPKDSELRPALVSIQQSGQRAAAVVSDLLTMARGAAAVYEVADLNTIITDYYNSPECRYLRQDHPQITCELDLAPDLLHIHCSQIHIRKCIMNLLANAAEAIQGQGQITISTGNCYLDKPLPAPHALDRGEYVLLTLCDNGTGIPKKDLPHIFEPFYTKKVMGKSGTGLGLTVVSGTVQDHGGSIDVKTDKKGTCFSIYLPATRGDLSQQLEEEDSDALHGNNERILVVDDEPQQRDIAEQMLTTLGYRVQSADSGQAAVDILQGETVDLIVLDMIMEPGLNGRETYEKILTLHPDQKAIIASGFSENSEVSKTLKMGAGIFIRKPYTLNQIGRAVKTALAI